MEADVGVIGLGAMGSMTLWHLASRGIPVLGFERYRPGHANGSSHGESRIFRTAYAEGSMYVPLLQAAYTQWRDLESQTGAHLLHMTGGLMIGPAGSRLIHGVLTSAREHRLEHRILDREDLRRLHPQHIAGADDVAVFETQAGFLTPEAAVRAAAERAIALGATVVTDTQVTAVEPGAGGVTIICSAGDRHRVRQAVVAVGAWTNDRLPAAALPLTVERNVQLWFGVLDPAAFDPTRFPVFIRELPDGATLPYGFPSTDGRSIKLAIHHSRESTDPDELDREIRDSDIDPLRRFIRQALNGVSDAPVTGRVCMYTNTPDERFVVGHVPGIPDVTVVSACSGHGFKFAPVIGDIAADLATTGETRHHISAFAPARFTSPHA